jgi:UDP-N-acetylmuramoyl-tripeptide--D-alanyl-D-alanine ligase
MITKIFRAVASQYSFLLPKTLLSAYRDKGSSLIRYIRWYYTTDILRSKSPLQPGDMAAATLLLAALVSIVISGLAMLIDWTHSDRDWLWPFGVALLVAYPFLTAHLLVVGVLVKRAVWFMVNPKKAGRAIVAMVLEAQVRQLRRKRKFTIVAVAGSVGKTSTKLAIAELLGQNKRVLHQAGNYNDRITVPLVFFNQSQPSLVNPLAWLRLFGQNAAALHHPFPYDVVVVELGTDGPGQMREFAYLKPDITVVTSVTPEHMEYFKTLDAVAAEELSVFNYSKRVVINADDIAGNYVAGRRFASYSLTSQQADYYGRADRQNLGGQRLQIQMPSGTAATIIRYIGMQGAKFAVAAAAVADILGMSAQDISAGLARLQHFAGRMQIITGYKNSTLIDDTYNASPVAVCAALDVLYAAKTKQRIAVLGSMNELGDYSREAHREVGAYCNPRTLDMVVTIGAMAKEWLAPVAKERGCQVHSFTSPYDAGVFVRKQLKEGAVVLAKGSQNGVFAEEAVKALLAHPADAQKLVRQSPAWLRKKARQFER